MTSVDQPLVVGLDGLQALLDVLDERGVAIFGPQERDGAITVRPLRSVDQLPAGRRDEQSPGRYRLVDRDDAARFGWAVGPQTWKPLLHPPHAPTATMTLDRERNTVQVDVARHRPAPRAFVGVRPCELAAIGKLDNVLLAAGRPERGHPDPTYAAHRAALFVVVVNCTAPAATCFCPSMGTGPALDRDDVAGGEAAVGDSDAGAPAGDPPRDRDRQIGAGASADVELTELLDGDGRPRYLARARSADGRDVLAAAAGRVAAAPARARDLDDEREAIADATSAMRRRLDTDGLPAAMTASPDHRRWGEIADRCLACGNCTAVCPTCFCTSVADVGDLSGELIERSRHWDSCFSLEFSRVGPRIVRESIASRYRQWLTHKLGTWHDQFGESGCVGCGRCITWCPVGIDLTAEVPLLRERPGAAGGRS